VSVWIARVVLVLFVGLAFDFISISSPGDGVGLPFVKMTKLTVLHVYCNN